MTSGSPSRGRYRTGKCYALLKPRGEVCLFTAMADVSDDPFVMKYLLKWKLGPMRTFVSEEELFLEFQTAGRELPEIHMKPFDVDLFYRTGEFREAGDGDGWSNHLFGDFEK